MAQLTFSPRAFSRPQMGLPEARLVNLFTETTPHGPTDDARLPRPGLASVNALGSGPIRGMFAEPGVFGGAQFVVSGDTAYLATGASLGVIGGDDNVRFAASPMQLVAVGGGRAYLYEGGAFAPIDDADLPDVSDVCYIAGRFVYAVAGSDRIYWSEPSDAANVDALSFATAEGNADLSLGLQTLGDELFLFGATTVEIWFATQDADAPFQRGPGRQYARGCASRDSLAVLDNSIFFLGDDRIVYRTQEGPKRVSTFGIEERLRKCATVSQVGGLAFTVEGHAFYLLNIPGQGSFAFDVATGEWAEWQSYGRETFRGRCSLMDDGVAHVGDAENGTIWALTPGVYLDGADPITFLASTFAPLPGGVSRCDNIVLQGARGVGRPGQGFDPVVEMRYSDDQGRTWSKWRGAALGKVGEYTRRPVWQRLGLIREPGRAFEFRTTDPVLAAMSGVLMNVQRPHG